MSKFAKDIKVNDILWTISEGDKPQLLPLIITNINVRKLLWTGYYDLTLRFPDGSEKIMSLFDTGERRDYCIPWLTDICKNLDDIINGINSLDMYDTIHIMACFDKDKLWKHYVAGLEYNINLVEELIKNGKKNLEELTKKLNYIKKQHENTKGIID